MTDNDTLRAVFRRALELPPDLPDTEVDALEYRGIEQWDSVAHMQLVTEIEETFDILIDTDDVIDMSSFGRAVEIVERYKAGTGG